MPNRFALSTLLIGVTLWCGVAAFVHWFGLGAVILYFFAPVLVTALWGVLYRIAPDATLNISVLIVIGLCLFALSSPAILDARDESRTIFRHHQLRRRVEELHSRWDFSH